MNKPKAVLFDVDGTLCDVSSIRHLVDRTDPNFSGKREFDRFHSESINCPPHQRVIDAWHQAKADGFACIVATGRTEKHREVTAQWLANHGLTTTWQAHRPDGDFRPDVLVKHQMLIEIRRYFDVIEVWDDNPHVIEMWRAEGLKVNVMPGWPVRDGKAVAATSEKEYASDGA